LEEGLQRSGSADRVERGVRDEAVQLPADEKAASPADLSPLHAPLRHGRGHVPGEGVLGLVVVVVAVEQHIDNIVDYVIDGKQNGAVTTAMRAPAPRPQKMAEHIAEQLR